MSIYMCVCVCAGRERKRKEKGCARWRENESVVLLLCTSSVCVFYPFFFNMAVQSVHIYYSVLYYVKINIKKPDVFRLKRTKRQLSPSLFLSLFLAYVFVRTAAPFSPFIRFHCLYRTHVQGEEDVPSLRNAFGSQW